MVVSCADSLDAIRLVYFEYSDAMEGSLGIWVMVSVLPSSWTSSMTVIVCADVGWEVSRHSSFHACKQYSQLAPQVVADSVVVDVQSVVQFWRLANWGYVEPRRTTPWALVQDSSSNVVATSDCSLAMAHRWLVGSIDSNNIWR